ncbi:hypothetical protein CJD36_015695 [Flavipsychrobacter stenotrophus]|uniref:Uncharacterized protein n=2 Tax=Flavipsychrobacter stenotrophus TaxID=2077091 RepID=A0A2S7ST72_9BACT|nr:hypothetical protein CJD36_015695 [Flavipsychrobacter stenotrophus]
MTENVEQINYLNMFLASYYTQSFAGRITPLGFKINSVYRKGMGSAFIGKVSAGKGGTTIDITVRPNHLMTVLWLSPVILALRFFPEGLGVLVILSLPLLAIHIGVITLFDKSVAESINTIENIVGADHSATTQL